MMKPTEFDLKPSDSAAKLIAAVEKKEISSASTKPLTFGQRLADRMASKVGSWPFLIGQTTVLAGWVGANMMPGVPHWDESPFILLNLVFSFASAYTAPIVLMSQNRQSDEDRENAAENHRVNLETAANLELLSQRMSTFPVDKLDEILELVKQRQNAPTSVVFSTQAHTPDAVAQTPATQGAPAPIAATFDSKKMGVFFVDMAGQQTDLETFNPIVTFFNVAQTDVDNSKYS
jgi:uncharacterized membrane protein